MARRWISVVRFKPAARMAFTMCAGRPARVKAEPEGSEASASAPARDPAPGFDDASASLAARATSHGLGPPRLYAVLTSPVVDAPRSFASLADGVRLAAPFLAHELGPPAEAVVVAPVVFVVTALLWGHGGMREGERSAGERDGDR